MGNGKLEVGSWKLEMGSWKWEVGNGKWEMGSWKWEVGNGKTGEILRQAQDDSLPATVVSRCKGNFFQNWKRIFTNILLRVD